MKWTLGATLSLLFVILAGVNWRIQHPTSKKGFDHMLTRVKRMRPWLKWTLGTVLGLFILGICGIGYLFYQVKSISLEDIKERQSANAIVDAEDSDETEVPKALDGAVGKANEFANKPIETQDALDVAAILLNSGLSFKEIYWLQGSASDDLPTEEKQRIRDLLLEKLSAEEIEALRSITTQYGKGLLILDPNYPIEAVGVKDEAERARIIEQANAKQPETNKPEVESEQTTVKPVPIEPEIESETETATKPISEEQQAVKEGIQADYNSQLSALQSSCVAKSNALASQLVSDVKGKQANGEEISIDLLQNTYLPKIAASEAQCDNQFSFTLANAKLEYETAGLDSAELNEWQSTYNSAKAIAKSNALSQLSAALSAK
ncbi:hypothetical protein L1N85_15210 [Paenibacillus alkaliterrae]|uniref:hypothetical protein n=1 Tax=Paenibacillus alkaliterrae TaxID=320909 RepID=UPI001F4497F2|nr:hypothetical protein [Paenibacillus alkaliterrae]MCF2939768.1 hypothetical protein [Paenibacillus alkaliterrae]